METETFHAHFCKLAAPMAVVDPAGKMIAVNEAFCRYLGYSRSEFLSMSVYDYTHPADLDRTRKFFRQVAAGVIDRFQYEKRYLHKDGTEVWAVVTTSWQPESGSNPPLCIAVIQDISERVAAEQASLKSETFLSALVDNIDVGIALIDQDHTILKVNRTQARMFHRGPLDFLGKQCFREFEKREGACPHCPGVRAMKDGSTHMVDTERVRHDGSRFQVKVRAIPVFDPDGKARKFIEVVENITPIAGLQTRTSAESGSGQQPGP